MNDYDDCDCNQNPSFIVDVTQNINLGANYLAQAAWGKATTPARMVAGVAGRYTQAAVPSQYRALGNSGHRLVGVQRNVDVTGWYRGGEGYTSHLLDDFSREGSARLRSNNEKKALYLRHMNVESPGGNTGFTGSILGAGLIDSFFQILGDWASNLCLSPEQYVLRVVVALEFGLLAGVFGAAAAVFGVTYLGFSTVAAAGASIGVSYFASKRLDPLKQDWLRYVTFSIVVI